MSRTTDEDFEEEWEEPTAEKRQVGMIDAIRNRLQRIADEKGTGEVVTREKAEFATAKAIELIRQKGNRTNSSPSQPQSASPHQQPASTR